MSGFVDIQAGYVVALSALSIYGTSLVVRERSLRRRLPPEPEAEVASPGGSQGEDASR